MDTIVFYQPPSPKWPYRSALDKSVPEPMDDEDDDGWEPPSLSEILAEAKKKRASVPGHQDRPPLVQERVDDGGRPVISQTSARVAIEDRISANVCSSSSRNNRQKNHSIEPHADLEPSQLPGSQQNLAVAAPKALDSISQDERARCSTSLDVVDDQATHKETVTGAQNDKQHRFGDQRSSSRAEMSIELDRNSDRNHGRDRDRQEGGAAAGNVYDIFAEYERIFGTTRKHCGVGKQGKDRGNDVIGDVQSRNQDFYPSRSHAASPSSPTAGAAVVAADESGCDTGSFQTHFSSRESKSSRDSPLHDTRHDSMLTAVSKRLEKRPGECLSVPTGKSAKRIRTSDSAAPLLAEIDGSPNSSSTPSSKDAPLESSAAPQRTRPPPVDPEDNQYLVRRLLKRRAYRHRGRKVVRYLVEWEGYGAEHNCWVREADIHRGLVEAFNAFSS